MTQLRKDALQELLAKVEDGCMTGIFAGLSNSQINEFSQSEIRLSERAFDGSLDAAKDLHNAVLPTAQLGVIDTDGGADVRDWDGDQYSAQFDGNPARAWLIAIIKALIAEADKSITAETIAASSATHAAALRRLGDE